MALVDTGACQKSMEDIDEKALARILQMDIADEESASASYDKQIDSITDAHVKEVLEEIRNDEYDHIKKLTALIKELNPDYEKGTGENTTIPIDKDKSDNQPSNNENSQKEIVNTLKKRRF